MITTRIPMAVPMILSLPLLLSRMRTASSAAFFSIFLLRLFASWVRRFMPMWSTLCDGEARCTSSFHSESSYSPKFFGCQSICRRTAGLVRSTRYPEAEPVLHCTNDSNLRGVKSLAVGDSYETTGMDTKKRGGCAGDDCGAACGTFFWAGGEIGLRVSTFGDH